MTEQGRRRRARGLPPRQPGRRQLGRPVPSGPQVPADPPEQDAQPEPPVDLNEFAALQATDALLDRLGGRRALDDDLADPLAGLFAELTRDVDLETDASRRFRAVLAGRTAQDGSWRLEPPSTGPIPEIPARAAAHRREARGHGGRVTRELFRLLPSMGVAAAVVTVVAGGVVAAVTGDPMAPIAVVNEALGAPQTVSYQQVQESIRSARQAVRTGDPQRARNLIDQAKDDLDKVAAPQQPELGRQITNVEQSLTSSPTAVPTAAPTRTPDQSAPVATPSGTVTGTGTATATATDTPTATPTDTGTPTAPSTSSPTPSTAPSATSVS